MTNAQQTEFNAKVALEMLTFDYFTICLNKGMTAEQAKTATIKALQGGYIETAAKEVLS